MIEIKVFNDLGEDVEIDWTYEWHHVEAEDRQMARLLEEDPDNVVIRITRADDG